ncbi:MAG: hypothetical protein ACK559_33235, partial [bacterium]
HIVGSPQQRYITSQTKAQGDVSQKTKGFATFVYNLLCDLLKSGWWEHINVQRIITILAYAPWSCSSPAPGPCFSP